MKQCTLQFDIYVRYPFWWPIVNIISKIRNVVFQYRAVFLISIMICWQLRVFVMVHAIAILGGSRCGRFFIKISVLMIYDAIYILNLDDHNHTPLNISEIPFYKAVTSLIDNSFRLRWQGSCSDYQFSKLLNFEIFSIIASLSSWFLPTDICNE